MRNIFTITFVFLGLLIAGNGYAQYSAIDSLNNLAEQSLNQSRYSAAFQTLQQSLAASKKINYKKGEGAAYLYLSNVEYYTRNFVQAEKLGNQAIDIFNTGAYGTLLAKSWVSWAQAVWAQSRFDEATNGFEKGSRLFEEVKDSADAGSTYSLMGMEEEERGNYEKSFDYFTRALRNKDQAAWIVIGQLYADVGDYDAALEYYTRVTDGKMKILDYLKIGEAYFLKSNYDSAVYFYRYFLSVEGNRDSSTFSKPYVLLGEVYLAEKKFDSSLYYLQHALGDFREVNDRNWVMRSLLQLGRAYKEIGQLKAALACTRELLSSAEATGARQYARDAHYLLYELFASLKANDSAYTHLKEYTLLNNAIGIDLSARKLAFYKASAQLEQASVKIDLLNRQRQLQDEEIKQAREQKLLLLVGVAVLIILFVILGRNFLLKKRSAEHLRKLAENELEIQKLQHTKKLSELEMQVLRVQMNPHFIFNSLNSINRFILRNNKADASAYLTKFSRLVRMILQNSQNAFITLENELDSLRLYLELEMLRFDNQFCYRITVDEDIDTAMLKVPPLVMQPFVENAIWHGLMPRDGKGQVDIHVSTGGGLLLIKIIDDGVGRSASASRQQNQAATHRPLGLQITSQRINMTHSVEGDILPITISDLVDESNNPAGTEVTLKLPLLYD